MSVEVVQYSCRQSDVSMEEVKKNLPLHLRERLMPNAYGVQVEASKAELLKQLDDYFKIGSERTFYRALYIEADRREIAQYTHFYIDARRLELARHVFFDMVRPECQRETCPWGARIIPPVKISSKVLRNLAIARIERPWWLDVELAVSPHLKGIFESEGVTGLRYDTCLYADSEQRQHSTKPPAYIGFVVHTTWQRAREDTDITALFQSQYYCPEHHTHVAGGWLAEPVPRQALLDVDLQTINRAKVGQSDVYFQPPQLVVSRKMLELLLRHKVPGLRTMTYFVKETFLPVIVSS